jgi:hypothetical protein
VGDACLSGDLVLKVECAGVYLSEALIYRRSVALEQHGARE